MRRPFALGQMFAVAVRVACAQDQNAWHLATLEGRSVLDQNTSDANASGLESVQPMRDTVQAGVLPVGPVGFSAWERYGGLLFLLLPLAAFVAIYVKFKHLWQKRASQVAALFAAGHEQQDMEAALLSFLCPSIAVNRYTFKGMEPRSDRVSLSFDELGLELHDGRSVLEGVTGHFQAGKLVAIMGPSGAGKTTFLNVLSGRATYGKQTGQVRVNGEKCDLHSLQSVTGFVPQDDIVHERFTVRENLWYSAQLRNEAGTPAHVLEDIVVDVLNVLQIGDIQMSLVGGVEQRCISGGERKRVNIELELVASPTILFMDEPTSGLDSSSALMLINSMKKITQLGMTVIMVIHQPRYSIFTQFDSVLLLGRGGRAAFLGSSLQTMPYFSALGFELPPHANPAEWFMDILTGECKPLSAGVAVSDLPTFWNKTGSAFLAQNPVDVTLQSEGVGTTCARKELLERWSNMGMDQSNGVNSSELKALLTRCMGAEPRDAAFSLMCDRLFARKARVSQEELLDFMVRDMMRRPSQILEGADGACSSSSLSSSSSFSTWSSRVPACDSRALTREIPGPLAQYGVICHRKCVEVFRNSFRRAIDILLLFVFALILGVQHQDDPGNLHNMFLTMLALSLCMTVSSVKLFGADRAMLERESSHGLSRAAYCLGGMTVDSVDVVLQGMVFLCTYYLVVSPPMPSRYYMAVFMMLALVVSGWGYVVSIVTPHQSGLMASVVLCFIQSGVLGHPDYVQGFIDGGLSECLVALSPTRWSLQMLLLEWFEVMKVAPPSYAVPVMIAFRSSMGDQGQAIKGKGADALLIPRDEQNHWWPAFWALACTAALLRVLAVLLLCRGRRLPLARRTLCCRLREHGRSAPLGEARVVTLSKEAMGSGASSGCLAIQV